jgi:hypothetical protein
MTWDLPTLLGLAVALSVMMYVVMDGFDLGVGILFIFAPSETDRDLMMNSVAPFWDGNETWLVLGGTLLIAAFPLAYGTLLPALYIPIATAAPRSSFASARAGSVGCGTWHSVAVPRSPDFARALCSARSSMEFK